MKTTLLILLASLAAFAADKPEAKKLNDTDARAIRELQLALAQASLSQADAQRQYEAAAKQIEAKRAELAAKVKAVETKTCGEGKLQEDLTCSAPAPKIEAKTEVKKETAKGK